MVVQDLRRSRRCKSRVFARIPAVQDGLLEGDPIGRTAVAVSNEVVIAAFALEFQQVLQELPAGLVAGALVVFAGPLEGAQVRLQFAGCIQVIGIGAQGLLVAGEDEALGRQLGLEVLPEIAADLPPTVARIRRIIRRHVLVPRQVGERAVNEQDDGLLGVSGAVWLRRHDSALKRAGAGKQAGIFRFTATPGSSHRLAR